MQQYAIVVFDFFADACARSLFEKLQLTSKRRLNVFHVVNGRTVLAGLSNFMRFDLTGGDGGG